jgi:Na+/proline symporter
MVVGVATVAYLTLNKMDPFIGLNAGFFALCVNFVVTTLVSLLTPARANPFEEHLEGSAAP